MNVAAKLVMLPITGCAVLVVTIPSELVNIVFPVTGIYTAGLNSAAQVRVTLDPKGGIGLGMLLDSIKEAGAGTVCIMKDTACIIGN